MSNNEMLLLLKETNERVERGMMHQNEMKIQLDNVQKSLDTVVQYIEQEKSRKYVHSEPSGTSLQKGKKNVHGRNQQKLHLSIHPLLLQKQQYNRTVSTCTCMFEYVGVHVCV